MIEFEYFATPILADGDEKEEDKDDLDGDEEEVEDEEDWPAEEGEDDAAKPGETE